MTPLNFVNKMSKLGNWINTQVKPKLQQFGNWIGQRWNDITGQTAINQQNQANLQMANYQAQMQEEYYNKYSSPAAIMRQLQEAGLNPNLAYGAATGGQSNVPSFNAPHIERNMSTSDKLNKALSVISSIQGLKQGMYQAQAAREAAEQSGLKTLNDLVNYRRNARDYDIENQISGYTEQTLFRRMFKKRRGAITQAQIEGLFDSDPQPEFNRYISAARQKYFQDAARPGVQNRRDTADAVYKEIENSYLEPYLMTRNMQQALNYDIDAQWKNITHGEGAVMGVLGPLLNALSRMFKK